MDAGSGAEAVNRLFTVMDSVGLGWLWLFVLAVWGGTASYIGRIRKSKLPFSFVEWVGECTISGFAGVVVGYLGFAAGLHPFVVLAFAGISGHMGGKAIAMLEEQVGNWLSGGKP